MHRLQLKLPLEIGIPDLLRLVLGPRFQAHLFDQAQIEDLGIVRGLGSPLRIRVKMVTGKIIAVTANVKSLLLNTSVDAARFGHAEEGDRASLVSTSLADRFFLGDSQSLGNHGPELFILIGEIHGTIEAIQSAGRRHSMVIHYASFLVGYPAFINTVMPFRQPKGPWWRYEETEQKDVLVL